jgi:hypothetical protein
VRAISDQYLLNIHQLYFEQRDMKTACDMTSYKKVLLRMHEIEKMHTQVVHVMLGEPQDFGPSNMPLGVCAQALASGVDDNGRTTGLVMFQ